MLGFTRIHETISRDRRKNSEKREAAIHNGSSLSLLTHPCTNPQL